MTGWLWALAPWSGVIATWLVTRHLTRRDTRLGPPQPGLPCTIIVPPCGCVNTFTRTDIIRCPPHEKAAAQRQQDQRDEWAAEWNERLHKP